VLGKSVSGCGSKIRMSVTAKKKTKLLKMSTTLGKKILILFMFIAIVEEIAPVWYFDIQGGSNMTVKICV
jgi:hypothetical protein